MASANPIYGSTLMVSTPSNVVVPTMPATRNTPDERLTPQGSSPSRAGLICRALRQIRLGRPSGVIYRREAAVDCAADSLGDAHRCRAAGWDHCVGYRVAPPDLPPDLN